MVRAPCCEKMGLKKGPWTAEEDQILISYIKKHGHSNWRALPKLAGLLRCGKSCRLRWINYLRPDIKRGNFTQEEEDTVLQLHEKLGNRWSAIAAQLPGRTDNEIKNFWHTHLKKRVVNKQSHVYEKKKADSAIVEAKSKPPQKLDCSNQYELFPSSSLDLSSLTDSPTALWDCYNESQNEQHIEIFEAFHQTCGGLWPEKPSTANFNGPIFNSSAVNDEEQVQSPFRATDSMDFGCYYDSGTKMDDSMEFWYKVFVKAGGSLNDAAF